MTVGFGIEPNLLTLMRKTNQALAGLCKSLANTAGGELHPALKTQVKRIAMQDDTILTSCQLITVNTVIS
jgi:hypothetical protein